MEQTEQFTVPEQAVEPVDTPPTVEAVKARISKEVSDVVEWVLTCEMESFLAFEQQLIPKVFALGRLFIALFLCMREEHFRAIHSQAEAGYKRQGPLPRWLGTWFGKVRYWRT